MASAGLVYCRNRGCIRRVRRGRIGWRSLLWDFLAVRRGFGVRFGDSCFSRTPRHCLGGMSSAGAETDAGIDAALTRIRPSPRPRRQRESNRRRGRATRLQLYSVATYVRARMPIARPASGCVTSRFRYSKRVSTSPLPTGTLRQISSGQFGKRSHVGNDHGAAQAQRALQRARGFADGGVAQVEADIDSRRCIARVRRAGT